MTRSALEMVTLYNLEIWNKGRIDLVPELCAERMTRYDANSVTTLDLDEQIARIRHNYDELRPTFEPIVLAGDDEYVTLVWNVTGRDPNWKWCGIEVFRVVDGKIVEVWNGPYVDGRWIRGGTLGAELAGDAGRALPVMSADIEGDRGQLVVPLDSNAIAFWLAATFGAPDREGGSIRFRWRDERPRLDIAYAQHGGPDRGLSDAAVERLEIRWARSGLTNVTIDLAGTIGDGPERAPAEAGKTVRLAECAGQFRRAGQPAGKIVGASIALDPTARSASGELTIRIPAGGDPGDICGEGALEFGWQGGRSSLRFEAAAAPLAEPEGAFIDGDETEALFRWAASDIVASLLCDEDG
ncbi:MAG: nuclear transport factor 2 family protein [Sphingopyxis sp.]|nr:nuclear transport factor 2 family protein [Sphingopyxis sp.]